MRRLRTLVLPALAVVGLLTACSGEDEAPSSDPGTAVAAPTGSASFGPPPTLGGYVLSVVPEHGATISQARTRSPDPQRPQLPCFAVDFSDLPEQGQWFRVALDGAEVTTSLTWVVSANPASQSPPRACYATPEGLEHGRHTMVVSVRDPRNPSLPPRQTVSWTFEVTP